jgi:hypothetical protein
MKKKRNILAVMAYLEALTQHFCLNGLTEDNLEQLSRDEPLSCRVKVGIVTA